MFKPHFGICICHGLKRLIVVKKGYCHEGNRKIKCSGSNKVGNGKRKSIPKQNNRNKNPTVAVFPMQKKRKPIQYRRKRTGELEIFKEIIEERGPRSQIFPFKELHGFDVRWFSHILGKQAYPGFRKNKKNIILKTPDEHDDWGNRRHKLKDKPEWKWIFDLEQELKREYYEQNKQTTFTI